MEEQLMDVELMLASYISDSVVKQLHEYYGEMSFVEILRVDRKEIYHSYFLKWLFEDKELAEMANLFLLNLLLKRARQQGSHFPKEIKNALLTNAFAIDNVETKVEDSVQIGKSKGRCDVLIEMSYHCKTSSKLYVFVENKVYSTEHNVGTSGKSQTEFYFDYYNSKYGKENCLFVFLDLTNPIDLMNYTKPGCKCEQYIHINYQDLLDFVLSPLARNESIQKRKQFILKEYIKGLSLNYSKKYSIMALEDNVRNLLIEFWNNNHQLIELSIEALSQDPNLDSDEQNAVSIVSDSIEKMRRARDTTHYKFGERQCNGKQELVIAVLSWCLYDKSIDIEKTNNLWQKNLDQLKECKRVKDYYSDQYRWTYEKHNYGLDDLKKTIDGLNKWKLIYGKDEYKNNLNKVRDNKNLEHNYKALTDKQEHWFFTQWGWANIDVFIRFYREVLDVEDKPVIELI